LEEFLPSFHNKKLSKLFFPQEAATSEYTGRHCRPAKNQTESAD